MIKINLLGEAKTVNMLFRLGLVLYVLSLVGLGGLFWFWYDGVSNDVAEFRQRTSVSKQLLDNLQGQTKEIVGLEDKKKLLFSKLAVLARIKESKKGPVRVLDDLNTALPADVWLRSVVERGGIFEIKGRALSNDSVSAFLVNLDKSDYFSEVELKSSTQMYYSKRTGQVQLNPDLQALRSDKRTTKEESTTTAKKWSVKNAKNKAAKGRNAIVDEFNIKINEFLIMTKVHYAGKSNKSLSKVEQLNSKKEEEEA